MRQATEHDVTTITHHRLAMFDEMGPFEAQTRDQIEANFIPWVTQRLRDGTYLGWLAISDRGDVAAGAGLWIMAWPPYIADPSPQRGYILNIYTESGYRKKGLARWLTQLAVDHCAAQRIHVVTLHASHVGRSIYESIGFTPTNEMRLDL